MSSLKLLVDNKHTIEKHTLEQTEDLTGLPIPFDQHKYKIVLIIIYTVLFIFKVFS